jgi:hypothetical protein
MNEVQKIRSKTEKYKQAAKAYLAKCRTDPVYKEKRKFLGRQPNSIRSKFNSHIKKYGIDAHDWAILFNNQDGKCKACNIKMDDDAIKIVVDHCHKTGKVRGLLCHTCNIALGYLEHKLYNNWINYLKGFQND